MNKKAYIFTGYLGSGKTTSMVKSIEEFFKDKKVLVIVNEFGEVGIDGKVLSAELQGQGVVELNEGCICCVLYDELNKVLSDIQSKYDFDYLFIETSGLSEPFPIYSALVSLGYDVESVICLIDSLNYEKYKDDDVFKYQIGSANIIVLNKIDLVEQSKIESIKNEIFSLKEKYNLKNFLTGEYLIPKYELITTTYGFIPEYVFTEIDLPISRDVSATKDDHSHKDYVKNVDYYPNDALSYDQFIKIIKKFPKNLIRSKGILKFKDVDVPLLFNYTYGNYTFEEFPQEVDKGILVSIFLNELKMVSCKS
ncbi:MAG: GTP-binding protein [Hydrogenothermaceae bacterium]|nr:GTP-binding protein [Hydrogenothermaceae bacterium]